MLSPVLLLAALTAAPAPATDLFDGFTADWRTHWREQRLFTRPTRYETVADGDQTVLHACSDAANAGLLRELRVPAPARAALSWRWKIKQPLTANPDERTRAGDDYAARVFVIFETSVIPLRTRAINYVWAAHEAPGTIFASPYTANVAMIVLRSGDKQAGTWQFEQRDLLADYREFFGEAPHTISGVAVLVDTDNTGLSAEAWFGDLHLNTTPP